MHKKKGKITTFSFWIFSKWSNMHAAFQISGFFWSPIFVSYIWVSCGQEKFYNFFFYVCPFSSLVAHNTIAEQQGTKIGRFYYFSTVAGGGPDLTEIILAEIGIDFVVNYVAVIVKYEKLRMRAATPVHSFSSKATMFGQLA